MDEFWDFPYWKESLPDLDLTEYGSLLKLSMEDAQSQRRLILKQFAGTGALPYLPTGPEYRPMKGRFMKRLKEAEKLRSNPLGSCASESAHHTTPRDGCPPAAPAPAFHRQLVGLLHKKLKRASFRKSRKMGNRGSNGSAPSPEKKLSNDTPATQPEVSPEGSTKAAKETTKNAKNIPIDTKGAKNQFWPKLSSSSSPIGSIVESESADSLVSSCSQESSKLPDVRIESTSSPDTSSISSSLFVDVQDKFITAEDDSALAEQQSLLDADVDAPVFSPASDEVQELLSPPLPEFISTSETIFTPEIMSPPEIMSSPEIMSPPEIYSPPEIISPESSPPEMEDSDDEDDLFFHDTQEDATDSSEHSPLKTYSSDCSPLKSYCSPERHIGVTRSCPGTPDTHHASENTMFSGYRERKGSLGSMCRSILPTIGSIPRLDFRDDDILQEEDEYRNFSGSTQSVSVHRQHTPLHRPRFRSSCSSASRRDRSSSELCLHKVPTTAPPVIRRYWSQNLLVPQQPECYIKRVASLTLDKATIEKHVDRPKYLPQELDFSLYEKFQGQMLVNWFCSAFPEDHPLSRHELRLMAAQFCTNLLYAGVLKHVDRSENGDSLFRPDQMYLWSKLDSSEAPSAYTTPGRLSPSVWPPNKSSMSPAYSERELREVIADLHDSRIQKEHEKSSVFHRKPGRRIGEYEERVARLELQLEKYQTLAEIEELTRRAKYVSCPTSPHSPCAATQTEPPRPTLSSSSQYDIASCATTLLTRSRYVQTESIRSWSRSIQTDSGSPLSRNSVRVQTEDTGPDVIRGLPRAHSELSEILPSLVTDRKPYFYRPSGSVSSFSLSSSALLSEDQETKDESRSVRPFVECNHCCRTETVSISTQTEPSLISESGTDKLEEKCTELKLSSLQTQPPSLSETSSASSSIPPPPPMPGTSFIPIPPPMPGSNILLPPPMPGCSIDTTSSLSIPPPPPMPGCSIPPPPPMPGCSIPPPPPMPGCSIPPPPPMPGCSIPPPPPMPGCSIPPPPPMPGSGIPPPPPMPGSGIPPPPPMPGSGIPPPPPMPGSGIPPPPPMPGSGIPPPPPMPGSGIPPPPPMPGCGPPPPPPMPGCGPPPPPPMPGCGPPPPPPMPGMGIPPPPMMQMPIQQAYIVRKPAINPKQAMRPLYWTRIQINTPVVAKKENSECLWDNLEETPPESWEEFEELFSKQVIKKKTPAEKEKKSQKKAKEVAKLLDQKRSQNVGILISSLHLDIAEIQHVLYSLDTSTVSTDTLQSVYDVRPTPDELQMISSHRTAHPDVPLDKPEQFLWDLSLIPEYAIRVECIMFHASYAENLAQIENKLENLKLTCQLLVGKNVQNVISIILSLGNYMNGGNGSRGQADGFGLEILPKLRDVKSKDNSLTLLHFIVKLYSLKFEKETPAEECRLPIPEPSDVERAGNVHFDDLRKELDKLYVQTSACERKVSKILKASTEDQEEPLKSIMETFLGKAFAETRLQMDNLERCKVGFKNTQKFFRYQAKSNNESEWPKEFFSLWTSFCSDFKDIWKKEQQRRIRERIDQTRKKVHEIKAEKLSKIKVVKASRTGLKAKLNKKASLCNITEVVT